MSEPDRMQVYADVYGGGVGERELAEERLRRMTAQANVQRLEDVIRKSERELAEANAVIQHLEGAATAWKDKCAALRGLAQAFCDQYAREFRGVGNDGLPLEGDGWIDGFRADDSPDKDFLALRAALGGDVPARGGG